MKENRGAAIIAAMIFCTLALFVAMLMDKLFDTDCPLASLTRTVNEDNPAAVGVPQIVPAVLRTNPFGRDPLSRLQLYGVAPPEAAKGVEYAPPIVPLGSCEVETCRAPLTVS